MSTSMTNDAHFDLRLTPQDKETIEKAAAKAGQSIDDFAVSTLLEKANQILDARPIRLLTERDALMFLAILDGEEPNQALRQAATWYKENRGDSLAD